VVINGLLSHHKYFYKIVSYANSSVPFSHRPGKVRSFISAPSLGDTMPLSITLIGDMGIVNANDTFSAITALVAETDVFLHIGDLSYADDYYLRPNSLVESTYEGTWDAWQLWLSPITSQIPYMVLPGNHEAACQELLASLCPPGQKNFTAYQHRFRMPSMESGAGHVKNMWSSFDYGLVHFILLNTETDFENSPDGPGTALNGGPFGGPGSGNPSLLDWLDQDLKSANETRQNIPWIVVLGHRPIYSSVTDGSDAVRTAFEALFLQYKVDLYLCGHLHYYERLFPISNGVAQEFPGNVYWNPSYPVYVINGAAGNDERHTSATRNQTISAVLDDSDFGYSRIFVYNATHFRIQFYHSSDRSLGDDLWIVKLN